MKSSFFQLAALLTTSILVTSCAIPKNKFDAYDPSEIAAAHSTNTTPEGPRFEQLKIERKVSPALLKAPTEAYRVGPGDQLSIEVAEDANTLATTKVMPDGMLYYDVADGVNVKGRTLSEISAALGESLKEDYLNPVVSVNLADAQSQRFWTLGQVKRPGAYPIQKPTTLIDAISQAGGMFGGQVDSRGDTQETVDLDRSILIRDGDVLPVDFRSLIQNGDMKQNVYVQAGDYIYLPSVQNKAVYVLGEVSTPGPVYFNETPTLLSALASAGGTKKDAVVSKALIIRGSMSSPKVATININDVARGKIGDAALQAGDIVWVPRSAWTNMKSYVEAVVVRAAQAVAVSEGIGILGGVGSAGVTINAGN
ncbi:MAG: polysaccharide biosynthesis/export family protein [Verrucomicrobiales bacterium]